MPSSSSSSSSQHQAIISSSYHSQKATASELSLFEKLDTIRVGLSVLANTLLALITGVTRAKERRPETYRRYVMLSFLRMMAEVPSVRQQHYLIPPTDDAYVKACQRRDVEPKSVVLEDGTKAHWIGDPGAEKIILNFHGGGYVLPCASEMFEFMFQIIDHLRSTHPENNLACLMLSYDLAPRAVYPRQLQQAAMLLNHVLNDLKIAPDNILLAGDSAGGNLALALLSHITHPHPSTVLPIPKITFPDTPSKSQQSKKTSPKFRALVLLSPWLSFDTTAASFQRNAHRDCVSVPTGKKWSSAFLACPWPHEGATDNYNQAAYAPAEWWKDFPARKVLIVAGEVEVLVDGITDFEKRFREAVRGDEWGGEEGVEVESHFVKGEFHDQPNIDLQMGIGYKKDEGSMAKIVKSWIGKTL